MNKEQKGSLKNWELEFDRRIDGENYATLDGKKPFGNQYLAPDQDSLLSENAYPESMWEMDGDKIKDFIKSLLNAKEKAVRVELIDKIIPMVDVLHFWASKECQSFDSMAADSRLDSLIETLKLMKSNYEN